ncbi:ABC transporter ATP-binding protein [Paenibacillus abyssi]|nr:ATP-binding cassette domain-containing protein [Paenibacillus abyssi]
MYALEVQKLTKTFAVKQKKAGFKESVRSLFKPQWQVKEAVKNVDLLVKPGETVAFLGPNGAGKSTTIKMLTGILHPTSGDAQVLGCNPWKERGRLAFRIGTVFGQKSQLWYHLPPADSFELMSRVYELRRSDYLIRRDLLIERFELGAHLQTPVRKLSLGERMRCEIAVAFLHRPQLLFLDEPTIGLDVIIKQRIRELIAELNREEGTTVFLTSHDPGDIERLCKRAIIIHHGGVILDDPVDRLKREVLKYKTIRLKLREQEQQAMSFRMDGVSAAYEDSCTILLSVDTNVTRIETVLAFIVEHYTLEDVTIEDPPMEEVIKHIYASEKANLLLGAEGE